MKLKKLGVVVLSSIAVFTCTIPVAADVIPTDMASEIMPYGQQAYCPTCGTVMSSTTHYGDWKYVGQVTVNGVERSKYTRTVTFDYKCRSCGYAYKTTEQQVQYR